MCPVSVINYRDKDLEIPMVRGDSGDYAALIKSWLVDIMYGKEGAYKFPFLGSWKNMVSLSCKDEAYT